MIGALPRLQRNARLRDAVWLASGLTILANSRPYEGLILGVAAAIALVVWMAVREGPNFPSSGAAIVMSADRHARRGGGATGYYYYRVTGSPFRMTYQVNRGCIPKRPISCGRAPRPEPVYHHPVMRDFYQREFRVFQESRTLAWFLRGLAKKSGRPGTFILGPFLLFHC